MPSFKKFYKENRKKAIQSQKNSVKLLQLLMILCSYNFIKFSMCSYNFNVAVRISINRGVSQDKSSYLLSIVHHVNKVFAYRLPRLYNIYRQKDNNCISNGRRYTWIQKK